MKQWPVTIPSLVLIIWGSVAAAALGAVPPEIAQKVQAEGIVRVIARLNVQIKSGRETPHATGCAGTAKGDRFCTVLFISGDGWNPL